MILLLICILIAVFMKYIKQNVPVNVKTLLILGNYIKHVAYNIFSEYFSVYV